MFAAIIQAGGLGTRLRELTGDLLPKPMLPLDGRPMMEWQIRELSRNGIKKIVIIIGYLGDTIREYFGDGHQWNVEITYIEEHAPLGSAGALYFLKQKNMADDYFFIFGDVMFSMDLHRLMGFHKEHGKKITLVTHPNSHPYDSDLLKVDRQGRVLELLSKKKKRETWYHNIVNAGIALFRSDLIDGIQEDGKKDWEIDVVEPCISQGEVYAYQTPEYIKDVGTVDRFMQAEMDKRNSIWEHKNLSRKQKCIFLDRDGTVNELAGFVDRPEKLNLIRNSAQAIRMINESSYLAIIVTNQPVIARGECSLETLSEIHGKLETELGKEGAYLDALEFCPHHPDRGFKGENLRYKIECTCRKPKTGMIDKMVAKFNIDLSSSYMIGDTTRDIQTGENAGLKTVLVHTGESGKDGRFPALPLFEADDLLGAVQMILGNEHDGQ